MKKHTGQGTEIELRAKNGTAAEEPGDGEELLVRARLLAGGLSAADRALKLVLEQAAGLRRGGLIPAGELERIEELSRACRELNEDYRNGSFLRSPGDLVRGLRRT